MKNAIACGLLAVVMSIAAVVGIGTYSQSLEPRVYKISANPPTKTQLFFQSVGDLFRTTPPAPRYQYSCTSVQRLSVMIAAGECSDHAIGRMSREPNESVHDYSNRVLRECIADSIEDICTKVPM